MNILKYKYKVHKLVNTLFYIVVFVIGFVLGFGAKKLDFSDLISQVLMIDNAKAYTSTSVNENTILEKFETTWSDFSIADYPYISCYVNSNSASSHLICTAIDESTYNSLYIESVTNNKYNRANIYGTSGHNIYRLTLNPDLSVYANSYSSGTNFLSFNWDSSETHSFVWTNYDFNKIIDNSTKLSNTQKNSFKNNYKSSSHFIPLEFIINLEYNENLFKDNPDFKQVCVNTDTRFAITSNNITYTDEETELKFFNGIDFIWFSYVPDGLSTYLYSSAEDTKVTILTEEGPLFNGINPAYWYYLDEKSEIDKFFNTDSSIGEIYPGVQLELEGYTDKYSYYGWYFHPFVVHFDNTTDGNNYFNVFHFRDDINFYSFLENGLDYYEELENARNGNVCFYIKNDYDVIILNKDIFEDDIGETTVLGGDKLDIGTSINSTSLNSKGLFSKINLFIQNIRETITFVNNYIYELYISMPYIVQLFILTILGLIVVKILVGMVTR